MYLRNFFKVHVQKYIWAYYTVTVTYIIIRYIFFMHVQNIIKLITLLCTIVCIQFTSSLLHVTTDDICITDTDTLPSVRLPAALILITSSLLTDMHIYHHIYGYPYTDMILIHSPATRG